MKNNQYEIAFVKYLSKFDYGCFYKNEGLIKGFDNNFSLPSSIRKTLMIQTKKQLDNSHTGMCHDVSTYLYNTLNYRSNKYLIFMDEFIPNTECYSTHSFIIYPLFKDSEYIIIDPFTYPNIGYEKSKQFSSIDDAINYRLIKWIKEENHQNKYIRVFYYNKDNTIPSNILMNKWRDIIINISIKFKNK